MSCRVLDKNYIITNGFDKHQSRIRGKQHIYGTDIVGEGYTSCNIKAHTDGIVRKVVDYIKGNETDKQGMGFGNMVVIEHQNGVCTMYCHMRPDSVTVKVGQRVTKGQILGYMGSTGNSYGAHLDFSVIKLRMAWSNSINLVTDIDSKFTYYNPELYLDADLPYNEDKVYYRIQVGAFTFLTLAKIFRDSVSKKLHVNAIIKKYEGEISPYKVQVYAFENKANAEATLCQVQTEYPAAFITTKNGIDV